MQITSFFTLSLSLFPRNMGDSGDEMNIDVDKLPKDSTGETSSLEISDIVKLFTGVIQSQFKTFSGQSRAEKSESMSKKLKENSLHKIKSEGNRVQFEFNADLLEGLEKLESRAFDLKDSESLSIISGLSKKLKTRQKHTHSRLVTRRMENRQRISVQ
mgnify:CR=1 FL=1